MGHLTLTHPSRADLDLPQAQTDDYQREAITDIAAPLTQDRQQPQIHTRGRQAERSVQGRYTANTDTPAGASATDMRQAVADYIDDLESRVDQYQGDGYDLVDSQLSEQTNVVLSAASWQFTRGQPFEIQYDLSIQVGIGTNESDTLDKRTPTVNTGMDTYLEIDGIELPGMRRYESSTTLETEVNPRFNRDTADTNDIIITNRSIQTIVFEGTHTGPQAQRASDDAALDDLLATETEVQCKTKVPGYTLDGFVTGYESNFNAGYGSNRHDYRVQFTQGVKTPS